MTCYFAGDLNRSCCSVFQITTLGYEAHGVIFLSIFHERYDGYSLILSAPTIHQAIMLSESTSGTYLDGNAFYSLIGLAGFLLPRARCCHGFGCTALQCSLAPSVLGVSWAENAVIPLIFSPGGGIHPAATPLSPRWHTSTQLPPQVQTHSSTVKRIVV